MSIREATATTPPVDLGSMNEHWFIANAPCTYDAFELAVGGDPRVPDAGWVLDEVAQAGYTGIDLGPPGYLGNVDSLGQTLLSHGLSLCGGWQQMPFSEPGKFEATIPELHRLLDLFDAARPANEALGMPAPKPTLADDGSPARAALPAGFAARDRQYSLDEAGLRRLAAGAERAVEICGERGYEPTFHHHVRTYVESPWEIEQFLELTGVGLCLDTGHLLVGGGDPVAAVRDWGSRINHVHLKDARLDIIQEILRDGGDGMEVWRRQAWVALGEGDIRIDAVLDALKNLGYHGWLVVEQDLLPKDQESLDRTARDQHTNREFLTARGLVGVAVE